MDIQELSITDSSYPKLLKHVSTAPKTLYVRGALIADEPYFTVVGTRKPTAYGIEAARHFTAQLGQAGFTIVSGLAFGIDTIAHETALENNARTIAVLGSGPDVITPTANEQLGMHITENGALVSEFKPSTNAQKFHFPQRDRIMAGFSFGTLVIEAGLKSGALITARNATEQGRDVFAVPGPLFSLSSQGTNALIKQGAKLVTDIDDILEEYTHLHLFRDMTDNAAKTRHGNVLLSETETAVLKCLTEQKHLDAIISETGLASQDIQTALTMLELKRAVVKQSDGMYRKI